MDENKCVHFPRGNQPCRDDSFPEGGRCAQNAVIGRKHGIGGGLLFGAKLAVEFHLNRAANKSLIVELNRDIVRFEKRRDFIETTTRQGDVLAEIPPRTG